MTYVKSQHRTLEDGRAIPWIDENLDPFTGIWLARGLKINKGTFYGRGDHYNHSTFADLVVTGLLGLHPRAGQTVEVRPLLPADAWDWFCLDRLPYHGQMLTILWDRTGNHFHRGMGLQVFAGGRNIGRGDLRSGASGSYR